MKIARTASLEALRRLPATMTIPVAGQFFGLSRPGAYGLARSGQFPVTVRQVGARYYVLTSDLARALGIDPALLLADDSSVAVGA